MRFSLTSLFVLTTIVAWYIGLSQVSINNASLYIGFSFFALAGILFLMATTLLTNREDMTDAEGIARPTSHSMTQRIAIVLFASAAAGFVGFLAYALWVIASR